MLNRIEFRAVWRLGYQSYIFRNLESFGHMPSGAINEHDHEEVFEVFGDLLQKQVHHFSVCIREYERSHSPQDHAHCCIYVQKVAHNLPGRFWPHTFGSPTVAIVADPTKSALILRHENDWPCVFRISFSQDFGYCVREFFLKVSCSSLLACT